MPDSFRPRNYYASFTTSLALHGIHLADHRYRLMTSLSEASAPRASPEMGDTWASPRRTVGRGLSGALPSMRTSSLPARKPPEMAVMLSKGLRRQRPKPDDATGTIRPGARSRRPHQGQAAGICLTHATTRGYQAFQS